MNKDNIEALAVECGLMEGIFPSTKGDRYIKALPLACLEEFAKAMQGDGEAVYQICFDGNGNWVDVPSCEYDKEGMSEKRIVYTSPPNTQAKLDKAVEALEFLLEVKEHKDKHGKDDWYIDAQPIAWKQAHEALKAIRSE